METEIMAKLVRPFCGHGRATVQESPVDEAQRDSGLVVPLSFDGDDGVKRGVLLNVAPDPGTYAGDPLPRGTVVWYRGGVRIQDVVVVDLANILAYEADE